MRSAAIDYAPSRAERRNFQRVRVKIYGRFMLEDRTEHAGQVVDMSPGNVALRSERIGQPGEKVIAYIDHIGRVEGVVTRTLPDGFAMTVIASERKKRQARRPAHLARQQARTRPARRPPPRARRAAQPDERAATHRRPPVSVPHHRPVAVGRRDRDRRQAGASASRSRSARCAARSCAISRTASPSSSPSSSGRRRSIPNSTPTEIPTTAARIPD